MELYALAAFASLSMLFMAFQSAILERRSVYRTLHAALPSEMEPEEVAKRDLARPATGRLIIPGLKRLGRLIKAITPISVIEKIDRRLVLAGSPETWDIEKVLASKLGLGALIFTLGFWAFGSGLFLLPRPLAAMALGYVGYKLPDLVISSKGQARQELIRKALPDTLDLLAITVEAGLAFEGALQRVARNIGGPLGQELFRVIREMQIGTSFTDALRGLAQRTSVPELKSFTLSMIQADAFGISIAQVLNVQAQEMRIKRRQRAEERAQKVPVKIIFPLIFCIFPFLFVVLVGPAAIRIYQALFGG